MSDATAHSTIGRNPSSIGISSNCLVVPFLVNALKLGFPRLVSAPADFSALPYVTGTDPASACDTNLGKPFLAETTHAAPFAPLEFTLGPGIHLHFILPRGLRTGRTDPTTGTFEFPPAPDQWAVVRKCSDSTQNAVWRIDGTYVWPPASPTDPLPDHGILTEDDFPRGPIWPWKLQRDASGVPSFEVQPGEPSFEVQPGVPSFHVQPGEPPWRNVGITGKVTATDWANYSFPDGRTTLDRPLTAAGWGDPTFSSFYPACSGQFGFYDNDPVTNLEDYTVLGWYSDKRNDPMQTLRQEHPDASQEALRELLSRRWGWSVNGDVPTETLLIGKVSAAHITTDAASVPGYDIAIGASGEQALAVLLAAEITVGKVPDPKAERLLEAALLSQQLKGTKVDREVALDDLIQGRSFARVPGGERWVIRGKDPSETVGAGQTAPRPDEQIELPEEVAADLDALNAAQARWDAGTRRLEALRSQIYADWHRAMAHTDPTTIFSLDWVQADEASDHPVTADRIYRLIRQARLPALHLAVKALDKAVSDLDKRYGAVYDAVEKHNAKPKAPLWLLAPAPAAPFHAPSEPTVALVAKDTAAASGSVWRGAGLKHDDKGRLSTEVSGSRPANLDGLNNLLKSITDGGLILDPEVKTDAFTPFRMEWRAQLAARLSHDLQGAYPENWLNSLPPDYDEPVEIIGSALVTDNATPRLKEALQEAEARKDPGTGAADPTVAAALAQLNRQSDALVHTLDGFNDSLLQWDPSPQLPVSDPLGFDDHQRFANQVVRPAVGNAQRRAPRPDLPFVPLRAGALGLTGLRLIDSFGRCRDITPLEQKSQLKVLTTSAWTGKHGDFAVELPPRLLQGARLRVRWLDGADPRREWTPHPGRSPLCGWIVANTFASQLDLHDPDGALLGSLDTDGAWLIAPGRKGPATVSAILPPSLRDLAAAMVKASVDHHDSFDVASLADDIDEALEDIHPDVGADDQALALLLSRPLAVVQVSISIELETPPAHRLDPAALKAELDLLEERLEANENPQDGEKTLRADPVWRRRFERVRVPVTVGESKRLADGVVAWCEVYSDQSFGPLQRPHRTQVNTPTLDLALDPEAPTRRLLLIVDPTAAIHLKTPILPIHVLRLPGHPLDRAAKARELLTYSGPHLTTRTNLHAPIPRESGWDTQMLVLEPGRWLELGHRPLVDRKALEAKLDAPTGVWKRLLRDGVLTPAPGAPSLAYIAPLPSPVEGGAAITLEDRLAGYPNPAQLVAALHACGRALLSPRATLSFEPLELREAYLSVRRQKPSTTNSTDHE